MIMSLSWWSGLIFSIALSIDVLGSLSLSISCLSSHSARRFGLSRMRLPNALALMSLRGVLMNGLSILLISSVDSSPFAVTKSLGSMMYGQALASLPHVLNCLSPAASLGNFVKIS